MMRTNEGVTFHPSRVFVGMTSSNLNIEKPDGNETKVGRESGSGSAIKLEEHSGELTET